MTPFEMSDWAPQVGELVVGGIGTKHHSGELAYVPLINETNLP